MVDGETITTAEGLHPDVCPPGTIPHLQFPGSMGDRRARWPDGSHVFWSQLARWKADTLDHPEVTPGMLGALHELFAKLDTHADQASDYALPEDATADVQVVENVARATVEALAGGGALVPVYRTAAGTVACYLVAGAAGDAPMIASTVFLPAHLWPEDSEHPLATGTVTLDPDGTTAQWHGDPYHCGPSSWVP